MILNAFGNPSWAAANEFKVARVMARFEARTGRKKVKQPVTPKKNEAAQARRAAYLATIRLEALDSLRRHGPLSANAIGLLNSRSKETVREVLRAMRDEGKVRLAPGRTQWALVGHNGSKA